MDFDIEKLMNRLEKHFSPDNKKGLRNLTALWVVAAIVVFVFAFAWPLISAQAVLTNNILVIISLGLFIAWAGVLILMRSTDLLYYGDPDKNCWVKAFQAHLPTKHIAEKFGVSEDDAKYYWFEAFNKWDNPQHPRHHLRQMTFERGFSCRFVYTLRMMSKWVCIPALFCLLVEYAGGYVFGSFAEYHETVLWRWITFGVMSCLWAGLRLAFPPSPDAPPWQRFSEINKMHNKWIDDNFETIEELIEYGKANEGTAG